MAQLTRAQLIAALDAIAWTNGNNEVDGATVKARLRDLIDSMGTLNDGEAGARTLQQVLAAGNATGANDVRITAAQAVEWLAGAFGMKVTAPSLTANRTLVLPDKSGTLATLDDITGGGGSPNGGQPYSVFVRTTGPVTIATALVPGEVVDGETLVEGQAVAVMNQAGGVGNGIYISSATPTRHPAFTTFDAHPGAIISVQEGTVHADTAWLCSSAPGGNLGTDGINWIPLPTALSGITVAGFVFAFDALEADWSDPGAGVWRFDTTDIGTATQLHISKQDFFGLNVAAWLAAATKAVGSTPKAQLTMYRAGSTDPAQNIILEVQRLDHSDTDWLALGITRVIGNLPTQGALYALQLNITSAVGLANDVLTITGTNPTLLPTNPATHIFGSSGGVVLANNLQDGRRLHITNVGTSGTFGINTGGTKKIQLPDGTFAGTSYALVEPGQWCELVLDAAGDSGNGLWRIVAHGRASGSYTAAVGDGVATTYTLTHNLATRSVHVTVYRSTSPWDTVLCDVERINTSEVRLVFSTPPSAGQFTAIISKV